MENFTPSDVIIETIITKSNEFKSIQYQNIYLSISELNLTPEIEYKIDLSYLDQELLNVIVNFNDDDLIFTLDTKLKEIVLEMFKKNGIVIAEDIPIYVLSDILEQYVAIYNTDRELMDGLLNIVKEVQDQCCYSFTFCKLIDVYSSLGMGNLTTYILDVDVDVLLNLLKKYEEEGEEQEKIPASLIQNIAIFNMRYKTGLLTDRQALQTIKRLQLFNKNFERLFPIINEILNTENITTDEYIDTLIIGYISSKEGYNDPGNIISHLKEYSLIETYNDIPGDLIEIKIMERLKELRK